MINHGKSIVRALHDAKQAELFDSFAAKVVVWLGVIFVVGVVLCSMFGINLQG